jgi:hypothetical protein
MRDEKSFHGRSALPWMVCLDMLGVIFPYDFEDQRYKQTNDISIKNSNPENSGKLIHGQARGRVVIKRTNHHSKVFFLTDFYETLLRHVPSQ